MPGSDAVALIILILIPFLVLLGLSVWLILRFTRHWPQRKKLIVFPAISGGCFLLMSLIYAVEPLVIAGRSYDGSRVIPIISNGFLGIAGLGIAWKLSKYPPSKTTSSLPNKTPAAEERTTNVT
jgi:hypothetical protein